jgi:hypothetical protein
MRRKKGQELLVATVERLGVLAGLAEARVLRGIRWAVSPPVQEQVALRAHWIQMYGPATWSLDKKITHGLASTISSPPILRLPNCMPTFSRPEPKLFGSVTAWSVLNRALCLCAALLGLACTGATCFGIASLRPPTGSLGWGAGNDTAMGSGAGSIADSGSDGVGFTSS